MTIQNDNTLVTKGDLKSLYSNKIAPYLGANLMVKTNNSDYYSTDEKIVGVWTDGRPLYQKTYTGTFNSSNGENELFSIDSSVCIKEVTGYSLWDSTSTEKHITMIPYAYNPATGSNASTASIYTHNNKVWSAIWETGTTSANQYFRGRKYVITLKYTKTTDAANSAATTPGAYDINFPNTWVTDKEIFFGNGVYGFRIKGNLTATTANSRWTIDPPALAGVTDSFRIRSQGGCYSVNDKGSRSIAFGTVTRTGTSEYFCSSSVWARTESSAITGVRFSVATGQNCTLTTNDYYDFWVTYTK